MNLNLLYKADYAKSKRSVCRGCAYPIEKGTLRLAIMKQYSKADIKVPSWYHPSCFFFEECPKTVDDIEYFESLRWKDQEKIKQAISATAVPSHKGKKRSAAALLLSETVLKDFVVKYCKTNHTTCLECEQNIMQEEIQISKQDYNSNDRQDYHVICFAKLHSELGYFETADKLPGFESLNEHDQEKVNKQILAIAQEPSLPKKLKIDDETDGDTDLFEKTLEFQNKVLFSYRDKLAQLKTRELKEILEFNGEKVPSGVDNMKDRISDIMTFGALEPCDVCPDGQLFFTKFGYKCDGNLKWSSCVVLIKEPERYEFIVPDVLKQKYKFLEEYRYEPGTRLIKDAKPTTYNYFVNSEYTPLYNMEFVIIGNVNGKRDEIMKQITSFGGKVTTRIGKTVMAVISTTADVEKMGTQIAEAKDVGIHVVPPEFLNEAKTYSGCIPQLVSKTSICTWGSDPYLRLPPEPSSFQINDLQFLSLKPSTVKFRLKYCGTVDSDSGLEDRAHIYQSEHCKYTAVLSLVDILKQNNKYYKLQLLEADEGNQYWLFRSWGRIGTSIGGYIVETMKLDEAKKQFHRIYEKRTGNLWIANKNFDKARGLMSLIDVDYEEEKLDIKSNSLVSSKLSKPVQELIQLIYDKQEMKRVMLEFELNIDKMPLGKLSKSLLQNAYGVLTKLQKLVECGGSRSSFIESSCKFYSLVPHSAGLRNLPIINSLAQIEKKIKMVDDLRELEISYNVVKCAGDNNTIDGLYDQLQSEIHILDYTSQEYQVIQEYIKNAYTISTQHELELIHVFTIKHHGEEDRYRPFKKLHNRKLLWHGSRTTNFAGILSKGLCIAPPEAPVIGCMFGKGIYFADMVLNSVSYCYPNKNSNIVLLLLCEVALGEMCELKHAENIVELPEGKHSVKGIGQIQPDPQHSKELPDGVHVPLGIIRDRYNDSSLLYNEYVVYNEAQVNIKYLVKMKYKYKN